MNTEHLIPFDLSKAKSGYQIVTRDGTPVTEWKHFESATNNKCTFAVIGKDVRTFDEHGIWINGYDPSITLFLLPKETSVYRNVYKDNLSQEWETIDDAKRCVGINPICIMKLTTTETGKTTATIVHTY